VDTTAETDLTSMMGLADRVEAWARCLGIPPPPGAEAGERADAEGRAAPPPDTDRGVGSAADGDERVAREVRHEP
jgi:hypothetical protein